MSDDIVVPSRNSVRRAGEILRSNTATIEEMQEAYSTISHWRSIHYYPLNTFNAYFRSSAIKKKFHNILVAQRLKRLPSIIGKLSRFQEMDLSRMQDIAGVRAILPTCKGVRELYEYVVTSSRFRHLPVLPPKDYISNPKSDGYRSVHQVFKYANKAHPELNVLRIELQLRTKLQHSWATAVETLGIIEHSSFKTGAGSEEYKRYFKLCSALFSLDEKTEVVAELSNTNEKQLVEELKDLDARLKISSRLGSLALTAKHIDTVQSKAAYHLMELDCLKSRISLIPFTEKQLELAESMYIAREKEKHDDKNTFIVLISVGDIKNIKRAYPNYFLDTGFFLQNIKRILGKI